MTSIFKLPCSVFLLKYKTEYQKKNVEQGITNKDRILNRILNKTSINMKNFDLENRLVDFSVQIINLVEQIPKTRAGNYFAGQIICSGISIFRLPYSVFGILNKT